MAVVEARRNRVLLGLAWNCGAGNDMAGSLSGFRGARENPQMKYFLDRINVRVGGESCQRIFGWLEAWQLKA